MRKIHIVRHVLVAVCVLGSLVFFPCSGADAQETFKVLHIMSYDSSWVWNQDQLNGFKDALKDADVEYKVVEMDTKRNSSPEWIAKVSQDAKELIESWQPDALVVGLPLHADGSDSDITAAARRFMRQLEGRYRLPVHGMDERLSSHAASGSNDAQHTGIDAAAARIILQDWLDTRT